MALCIKGLRSGSAPVIKLSLTRIQSFIFNDYLANRFEQDDGVVMLVSLLGHQDVLSNPGAIHVVDPHCPVVKALITSLDVQTCWPSVLQLSPI